VRKKIEKFQEDGYLNAGARGKAQRA